jgi:hypothetical protein
MVTYAEFLGSLMKAFSWPMIYKSFSLRLDQVTWNRFIKNRIRKFKLIEIS